MTGSPLQPFSAHIDKLIGSTDCTAPGAMPGFLVVKTHFSYADPPPRVFQRLSSEIDKSRQSQVLRPR